MRRIVHTSAGTVHLEFTDDGQVEIALYDEISAGSRTETWPDAALAEGLAHVALIPVGEAEEITAQLGSGIREGRQPGLQWPRRYRALTALPIAVLFILVLMAFFFVAWLLAVWLL